MTEQDISCGFEYITTPDFQASLTEALQCGYSFIVSPVVHPRFRRHYIRNVSGVPGFTRSDMILSPQDWTSRMVAKVSMYLNVDSQSPVVRQRHEDCLNEELLYCRGLGVPAIMLPLHSNENLNLARTLLTYLETCHHPSQIWVTVPMGCSRIMRQATEDSSDEDEAYNETWMWWSKFHERLHWDKRVGVVLKLSADLPSREILRRWLGEPVKALIIPTYVFHNNRKGYPVLSRAHQQVVLAMVEHDAQVIISGARRSSIEYYMQYMLRLWKKKPQIADDPMLCYAKGWEDYLQTPLQPLADNLDTHTYNVFEKDPVKYNQYQKAIVLALTDLKNKKKGTTCDENIRNNNTSVIDAELKNKNDSNKVYSKEYYSKDHSKVIEDRVHSKEMGDKVDDKEIASKVDSKEIAGKVDKKEISEDTKQVAHFKEKHSNKDPNYIEPLYAQKLVEKIDELVIKEVEEHVEPITVMVLGAGRGPLVRATFNAADITKTRVKVVAVEKNPCAVVVLAAQVREVWRDRDVLLIPGDMRHINITPKADIIVSELLGSWGDNELSPECLDGAANLLKRDGISIPCEYNSYVAPISSPRLWAAAKVSANNAPQTKEKNLETLWVVYMQNKHDIGETKRLFTFTHPAKGIKDIEGAELFDYNGLPLTDNRRSAKLSWKVEQDNVMHGFGGYFDCLLYGEETISIVPSTHSEGMISWFPVFIPIKTPIRVQKGDTINATFWRCVDSRRVWYEWMVEVNNCITELHNRNGRSSEMLL